MTRHVSGRKTTGVGETIFLNYKAKYNEIQEHLKTEPVPFKKFDWERYKDTPVENLAKQVIEWGIAALEKNQFSRNHYKYAVQLMLTFLGVDLPNFVLLRPQDTSPARFLAHGTFYLEIFLSLNCPLVYEMYTSGEREEIILMAMYSSCYYLPSMIQSKYPSQITSLTIALICNLEDLKQVHPEIANCALQVVKRHLEPVSGELAILGIADMTLSDGEREEAGKMLHQLGDVWEPGHLQIQQIEPPTNIVNYQSGQPRPRLASLFNARSFLLLEQQGWTKNDLAVFNTPIENWKESAKYRKLVKVIESLESTNDCAER